MPHDDDGGNASAMGHSLETEFRDCVIVGGGIAGLAAARDLEAVGLDFVILEAGKCGESEGFSRGGVCAAGGWGYVCLHCVPKDSLALHVLLPVFACAVKTAHAKMCFLLIFQSISVRPMFNPCVFGGMELLHKLDNFVLFLKFSNKPLRMYVLNSEVKAFYFRMQFQNKNGIRIHISNVAFVVGITMPNYLSACCV